MHGFRLGLGISAAVAFVTLGYFAYSTLLGTPIWFNGLLDRQAAVMLVQQPLLRTQTGILNVSWLQSSSGDLGSYSLEARQAEFDQLRKFQAEIRHWDRSKLLPMEQLSRDIVLWNYGRKLANEKYPWLGAQSQLYAVNPVFGVQKEVPALLLLDQAISDETSAQGYIDRLKALGPLLDAVRADAMRQAGEGVIPPDFIVEESIAEMSRMVQPATENNPLVRNLSDKTAKLKLNPSRRAKLLAEANAAVRDIIYPAYFRLIAQQRAVIPQAGHEAGVWRLKDGGSYYADQLKYLTSTDMTPDEIHEYGLEEVARISRQMDVILKSLSRNEGSVGARMAELMSDPRFAYSNTEAGRSQMLNRYKEIMDQVRSKLPGYFSEKSAMSLDITRMPASGENDLAGAYYNPPSYDGKRPGIFLANLNDVAKTPMWAMPTLAYHEGIPGHHLQTSIAIGNGGLPLLRRMQSVPAYEEGWALYAEQLAGEIGLYEKDPFGNLGRLQAEMLRAARLVVDTGMHAKYWSREQAIQYMQSVTGMAPSDVSMEVDRYIIWPGQACSYMIGMKVILNLREKAISELGPRFDIREFHSQILDNGEMPLWLLQSNVESWITEKEDAAIRARTTSEGRTIITIRP